MGRDRSSIMGSKRITLQRVKKEIYFNKFARIARTKSLRWLWNIDANKLDALKTSG